MEQGVARVWTRRRCEARSAHSEAYARTLLTIRVPQALIDACKDNELDTVLELIGNDFQKSEVDLDCRIPMNHPNHPMYSRKRRSVMFEDSAFQICCTRGHEELVTYFINREEMNFRTTDMENMTPLHGSVSNDHLNIVKLLVKSQRVGNMLNERDRAGRTPMYLAAQLGLFEVLRFFATQTFRKKADFEAATVDGMTPLWIAARNGHFTCVKMLIEKGANIEHANKKDMRVLHAAVMSRDCKLVDYLVNEAGCELNAVDETNRTPFYLAAQNEQVSYNTHVWKGSVRYWRRNDGRERWSFWEGRFRHSFADSGSEPPVFLGSLANCAC